MRAIEKQHFTQDISVVIFFQNFSKTQLAIKGYVKRMVYHNQIASNMFLCWIILFQAFPMGLIRSCLKLNIEHERHLIHKKSNNT